MLTSAKPPAFPEKGLAGDSVCMKFADNKAFPFFELMACQHIDRLREGFVLGKYIVKCDVLIRAPWRSAGTDPYGAVTNRWFAAGCDSVQNGRAVREEHVDPLGQGTGRI